VDENLMRVKETETNIEILSTYRREIKIHAKVEYSP
jgi:hypothetical protein